MMNVPCERNKYSRGADWVHQKLKIGEIAYDVLIQDDFVFLVNSLAKPIVATSTMIKDVAEGEGDLTPQIRNDHEG